MRSVDMSGKNGVVFGVANQRSIAWVIARALDEAGVRLAITYQTERLAEGVKKLASTLKQPAITIRCDVTNERELADTFDTLREEMGDLSVLVHSIAFANRDDLGGDFSQTGLDGFHLALEVSAYSFIAVVRHAIPLMKQRGGSIVTMTFQASGRVFPGYNIMGTAKAALEHEVRQLAAELGPKDIRVNAISAGPLDTLAARGIHGFVDMKRAHAERSPLRRNITHDEVANAAVFLCSDMSSGITGTVLPVDSGYNIIGL